MRRSSIAILATILLCASVAQGQITLPPDGNNQHAAVTQGIGLVEVTIDYHSPDVHGPNGEDRRGKIWGELVPWGTANLGFGTCKECPWRAGANQNTTFTVSHDVQVEGKQLAAGSYALFLIPQKDADWTLILSKNHTSWGSFYYETSEDALRVSVKPSKTEYHEWLTYEFTDRQPEKATVALKWEDLQVPFTITVPNMTDLYLAQVSNELRNNTGFTWTNWANASQWALQNKRPEAAMKFAEGAVGATFIGQENFRTLSVLADAQEANGKTAEGAATRQKALNHHSAGVLEIHQYGRLLMGAGKNAEALAVFQLNAKRNGQTWPVNVGLARGYSAAGKYKDALKYAKLAVAQAPDEQNKTFLAAAVKKLEAGQDMNK